MISKYLCCGSSESYEHLIPSKPASHVVLSFKFYRTLTSVNDVQLLFSSYAIRGTRIQWTSQQAYHHMAVNTLKA